MYTSPLIPPFDEISAAESISDRNIEAQLQHTGKGKGKGKGGI